MSSPRVDLGLLTVFVSAVSRITCRFKTFCTTEGLVPVQAFTIAARRFRSLRTFHRSSKQVTGVLHYRQLILAKDEAPVELGGFVVSYLASRGEYPAAIGKYMCPEKNCSGRRGW